MIDYLTAHPQAHGLPIPKLPELLAGPANEVPGRCYAELSDLGRWSRG